MSEPAVTWKHVLSDPQLDEHEIANVTDVLRSGWLTQGPRCQEFEERFAHMLGADPLGAKLVSSCTAALHLGLAALGIGVGDEVIVPSMTFVATANCVRYVGAQPVFADIVSDDDFSIDPNEVERKITANTRAVICVHYAGYPAHMDALAAVCERYGLALIEDAAHAPLTKSGGQALGTIGDVGCFSFFSNKNLVMGEGGLALAKDPSIAERIGRMRSHGMTTVTLDRHKGLATG